MTVLVVDLDSVLPARGQVVEVGLASVLDEVCPDPEVIVSLVDGEGDGVVVEPRGIVFREYPSSHRVTAVVTVSKTRICLDYISYVVLVVIGEVLLEVREFRCRGS